MGVTQLSLGLTFKLRFGELDGNHHGEAFAAVITRDFIFVFQHLHLMTVVIESRGESALEAFFMHTAFGGMDIVGERENIFAVAIVILDGDFSHGVALGARHVDDIAVQSGLVAVVPLGKLADTAFKAHHIAAVLLVLFFADDALIGNGDGKPAIQKGLLTHAGVKDLVVILQRIEHFGVGLEGDGGTGAVGIADNGHFLSDLAAGKLHLMDLAVFMHLYFQPLGKRVYNRRAYAVETTGNLITAAAELTACMQHGKDNFQRGTARLRLNVYRDTAAVIGDGDGVALVDGDSDLTAITRQGFVDGVIHDFVHQVMKARRRRGADVHTGALADSLKTFQYLNFRGVIVLFHGGFYGFKFAHWRTPLFLSENQSSSRESDSMRL